MKWYLPDFDVAPFKLPVRASDGTVCKPDLALIAADRSCWFVIEVELASHSLARHIIPQVTVFVDGDYNVEHARYLASRLNGHNTWALEYMMKYKRPGIMVVVDSDSIERQWSRELRSANVTLTYIEVFYQEERGDSLTMMSGFIPEKTRPERILLRKDKLLNVLKCYKPTDSLLPFHSKPMMVECCGSMREMTVLYTKGEAMFFLQPTMQISPNAKYYLEFGTSDNVKILQHNQN